MHVKRDSPRTLCSRKPIGNQRQGGWNASSLADSDYHPNQQQLNEIGSYTARSNCNTPEDGGKANDRHTIASIRPTRDRQSHDRVEKGECNTAQDPQFRVAEPQVSLDVLEDQSQRKSVRIVEGDNHRQEEQQVFLIILHVKLNSTDWRHSHRKALIAYLSAYDSKIGALQLGQRLMSGVGD